MLYKQHPGNGNTAMNIHKCFEMCRKANVQTLKSYFVHIKKGESTKLTISFISQPSSLDSQNQVKLVMDCNYVPFLVDFLSSNLLFGPYAQQICGSLKII